MMFPTEFLEEVRARTPLPSLIGHRTKLVRAGRLWKGCCPFHTEKTPSFVVYDDHFHCFGCGAHGDAISFVMTTTGASFVDAIRRLAGEAGLAVPEPSAEAAQAQSRRDGWIETLRLAAESFTRRLWSAEGRDALAYLRGRGLSEATIQSWGLGFAGETRGALSAELARRDVTREAMVAVGLHRPPEDDRPGGDFFFRRIIFPIRDRRGQIISFGGRALGDAQPKYLNGPETALFDKGRCLFGIDRAVTLARAGLPVVVVEGYLDVIALQAAEIAAAVAPLGTALTEAQLFEAWRVSPAPVLCFDGDTAGNRASRRAIELALPHLRSDRTLHVAALPDGEDPDSLARNDPQALRARLAAAAATPLATIIFDLATRAAPATPEGRAAVRAHLETAADRIGDRALKYEYRRAMLDLFFARRGGTAKRAAVPAVETSRKHDAGLERMRVLFATLLIHPSIIGAVRDALEAMPLTDALDAVRVALLEAWDESHSLDSEGLINHLTASGVRESADRIVLASRLPLPPCAHPDAMPAAAAAGWWHHYYLLHPEKIEGDIQAARTNLEASWTELAQRRLIGLINARAALVSELAED